MPDPSVGKLLIILIILQETDHPQPNPKDQKILTKVTHPSQREKSFLEELGCAPWSVKLYCNNQGCIQNLKNPVYSKYTKHIAVQFHFAREAIKLGQVDIKYVETSNNQADMMTKPLVGPVLKRHVQSIGLLPLSIVWSQGEVLDLE